MTLAFTGGYWNIGAEGQLYAGAVAATALGMQMQGRLAAGVAIPLMIVGGFAGGRAVGADAGPAEGEAGHRRGGDDAAAQLGGALHGELRCSTGRGATRSRSGRSRRTLRPQAIFFKLMPRSRLHLGFLIAVVVLLIVWFVFRHTALGMRMRAVGLGRSAARFAGIDVNRTMLTAALVSGGIAGLAGVSEVAGIHYHLIDAISPGYGYSGIIVATLGGLNPFGAWLAALFIGLIDTGAQTVSRALGVPVYLGDMVQATLLLVTLALLPLQGYRIRRE